MHISHIEYLKLILFLSLWCFIHSAMISPTMTYYLKQHANKHYKYYRLFFNFIALITLIPLLWYKTTLQTHAFFDWDGWLRPAQIIFIAVAIVLFYLGAQKYDSRRFFGISQLSEDKSSIGITESGELNTSGILSIIRHPWYTGLLLLLWARPMDISTLILNSVFTLYLFIGVHLEEKKLVTEFGDTYKQYQKNTSMLLPIKWFTKKFNT